MEDADCVASATDACSNRVRKSTGHFKNLLARLDADDAMEIAHHLWERMRPGHGAQEVMRVIDVRDPIAHRLVDRILQRPATGSDRHDGGAEQFHAGHVQGLPLGVFLAHVDNTLKAEQCGGRCGGDAVLAGTGFRDNASLAHALGQQRLSEHVVDLVRSGVVEILALEEDARPVRVLRQPLRFGER